MFTPPTPKKNNKKKHFRDLPNLQSRAGVIGNRFELTATKKKEAEGYNRKSKAYTKA